MHAPSPPPPPPASHTDRRFTPDHQQRDLIDTPTVCTGSRPRVLVPDSVYRLQPDVPTCTSVNGIHTQAPGAHGGGGGAAFLLPCFGAML